MRVGSAIVGALVGCGPVVGDDGDGGMSGAQSSEASASASTADNSSVGTATSTTGGSGDPSTTGSTSVDPSTSTTESTSTSSGSSDETTCRGMFECEPCSPGCDDTSHCEDGLWSCECNCPEGCVGHPAQEFAEQSKTPPFECGDVYLGDDVRRWQELHDCVLEMIASETGFWASWSTSGDPYAYFAGGQTGVAYSVGWWEVSGPGTRIAYGCTAIAAVDACVVEVGRPCLTCVDRSELAILCDP